MSVLSVVLPAYNEELMIAKTCSVLGEVLTDAGIPMSWYWSMTARQTVPGKKLKRQERKIPIFWE